MARGRHARPSRWSELVAAHRGRHHQGRARQGSVVLHDSRVLVVPRPMRFAPWVAAAAVATVVAMGLVSGPEETAVVVPASVVAPECAP
jgi:hypothetical protein